MKRVLFGLLLACMILSLLVGCGKRDNPIRSQYPYQDPFRTSRDWVALQDNELLDPSIREVYVYLPPMYDPQVHSPMLLNQGFSVLYLLHDLGGDFSTFVSVHKIGQLADRLIEEGEIQPMIIVMPDASSLSVGGSFYTNAPLMGDYEDYIVRDLMAMVDSNFHTYLNRPQDEFIPDPKYRAIGGLGVGAYGALRMAMDYDTTVLAAVSAMSPFASLESFLTGEAIDKVFEENGIGAGDLSYASYKTLNPWPDDDHPDKTYSQLVFAMAAAFSPRSTMGDDTTNFFTLATEGALRHGVDLPFDETRTVPPGSEVWDKWLQFDVKTKLVSDPASFTDLEIYLDCGDQNEFGLLDGARALDQLLSLYGQRHTYTEYSGYPNNPAGHDNFIYDRLEDVLKFHSRNFPPPAYRGAD
jgi:S-formylglutathione hydrolase FrmB